MDIYQILRVRKNADESELQAKYLRLLDSYQMTATFAEDQEVADIAKIKLEQLVSAGKEYGLYNEHPESDINVTHQTNINLIKLILNSSGSDASKLRENNILGKINALPESAEKHYLKAVVNLCINNSLHGCQNVVSELHAAIKMDPSNEAYTAFLDAISEQIEDYEQRQRDRQAKDERERQERERRSQQTLADARRRQFWNSASPCIGGAASIGMTILVCLCGCACCESSCGC